MDFFEPKHNNHIFRNCGDGIFITSDGHVITSNILTNHLLKDKVEDSEDDDYEPGDIRIKYEIIYEGVIMSHADLMLVDNAISVCTGLHAYNILLSNFKIIHIYQDTHTPQILELNRICSSIDAEYITSMNSMILLYSKNKLFQISNTYKIGNSYKLEMYDNVIGYVSNANILLILFSDYRIACTSKSTLYKVEKDVKTSMQTNDIFGSLDLNEITCMSVQMNRMYIVINGIVHFWSVDTTNYLYNDIVLYNTILSIDLIESVYFCMLDDRLLIRGHNKSYKLESYLGVSKYLVCACYAILFHFDDSLTVFNFTASKEKRETEPFKNPVLHAFLTNPESRDFIDKVKIVLNYKKYKDNYYLVYLNTENDVEILDIVNLEFVDLNTFLCIDINIKKLHLIEYSERNYI